MVDLSNPLYVGEQVRLQAIKALGAGRCQYGTDGQYIHTGQATMLQPIDRLPLTAGEKEQSRIDFTSSWRASDCYAA